jgi:hypothetical protein
MALKVGMGHGLKNTIILLRLQQLQSKQTKNKILTNYKNNKKLFFLLNVSIGLNFYSYFYKTDLIIYC